MEVLRLQSAFVYHVFTYHSKTTIPYNKSWQICRYYFALHSATNSKIWGTLSRKSLMWSVTHYEMLMIVKDSLSQGYQSKKNVKCWMLSGVLRVPWPETRSQGPSVSYPKTYHFVRPVTAKISKMVLCHNGDALILTSYGAYLPTFYLSSPVRRASESQQLLPWEEP